MDPVQLAVLALLVGVALGGSLALVVVAAYRARDRALAGGAGALPEGVNDTLAGMDDAAVVVDPSGTVVAASQPAAEYGLGERATLPTGELGLLARAARAGTASAPVALTLPRGAEPRVLSARARSITSRLVLIVLRDVTEQERVERMRRDFVANTSHELKTPVGAIGLLAEAVESAADDPTQVRAFATRLQDEARRLGALTTRLMGLARLQSDEPAAMEPVAVDALLADVLAGHATAAEAAGVDLVGGRPSGAWVFGDAEALREAVGNLVANAIAYSASGTHVGVVARSDDGVVEITVADQGIGIAEADQERVFERFYRVDPARSRRTGGTGLGLSIVKHAVQRHGGEIRLWSRPGSGSTFTIRLPRVEPSALSTPRTGKAAKGKPGKGRPAKDKKKTTRKDSAA